MSFAIDWPLFFSTFGLIAVAELPDKTALACVLMGARNHPWGAFLGVAVAYMVQSLVAVAAGELISLAPEKWVHLGAGLLFVLFAVMLWLEKNEDEDGDSKAGKTNFWKSARSAFVVIFIAEWGDLTQLATATLQAKYNQGFTIFLAATLSLWVVSGVGIAIGHAFHTRVRPKFLNKGGAIIFLIVGLYFIVESIRAA